MSLLAALPLVGKLLDKVIPDQDARAKAENELATLIQTKEGAALLGQLEINKEEAKHPSWFVAGWRPFVGWTGGVGLAYVSVVEPLMRFIATMNGYTGEFPVIDTSLTIQVLMGMLGIGAMRSFDKKQSKETKGVGK